MSQINSSVSANGTPFVVGVTGNSGGEVFPDASGNLNLLGSGPVSVVGNPGTNTLTISLAGGSDVISITGDSGPALSGALTLTGSTTGLTFAGAGTTLTLGGDLVVSNGGTGNSTFTAYSVICAGTTATGVMQNVSGVGTSGQVLTSAGAGALPTWSANTGGFTWSVITADQSITVGNGYICNKAGLLTLTLPASGAIGDRIRVTGINTAVGWRIAQNANQQIFLGTGSSTIGVTGYIEATQIRDSVELICVVSGASTNWNVVSVVGNITVA